MWRWLIIIAGVLVFLQSATPAQAQRTQCFEMTGYCVSDPILAYWENNGGLAVFGYPISPLRTETIEGTWTGPTQWFERDRLEDHGAEGVLAGRLGALVLANQGRPWQQGTESPASGCEYFAVTGYRVCEPFLSYWRKNGGLARFGYPITSRIVEAHVGWSGEVQYFERRRMEWHTQNAATPYEVLLGRLGAATMIGTPVVCQTLPKRMQGLERVVPFALGCATTVERIMLTYQYFRNGIVFYLPNIQEVIYTTTNTFKRIVDTWSMFEIDVYIDGAIQITKQIGKAIMQTWGMRDQLGDVLSAATTAPATVVRFSNGAMAVQIEGQDTIYVFGGSPDQFITIETGP
ncbi:MAG: hypothetical protein FJ040_10105 [Chloroflexi bacterium]|nr:hypothetical protein [Chloroflexota bacterium]